MRSDALLPLVIVASATLLSGGCASSQAPLLPLAPMAQREIQTRYFEHVDAATAMKALVDTLQDGDFAIDRAEPELGLIVGTRSTTRKYTYGGPLLKWTSIAFSYGLLALVPWTQRETSQIEASANVSTVGEGSRIRITFQRRIINRDGRVKTIETLDDPELYANIFEMIGRSLFVADAPVR